MYKLIKSYEAPSSLTLANFVSFGTSSHELTEIIATEQDQRVMQLSYFVTLLPIPEYNRDEKE